MKEKERKEKNLLNRTALLLHTSVREAKRGFKKRGKKEKEGTQTWGAAQYLGSRMALSPLFHSPVVLRW